MKRKISISKSGSGQRNPPGWRRKKRKEKRKKNVSVGTHSRSLTTTSRVLVSPACSSWLHGNELVDVGLGLAGVVTDRTGRVGILGHSQCFLSLILPGHRSQIIDLFLDCRNIHGQLFRPLRLLSFFDILLFSDFVGRGRGQTLVRGIPTIRYPSRPLNI